MAMPFHPKALANRCTPRSVECRAGLGLRVQLRRLKLLIVQD